MGLVDFKGADGPARRSEPVTGRIGSSPRVHAFTATTIAAPTPTDRRHRFGPEIPVQLRDATRDMVRLDGGSRRSISFMRHEFALDVKDARSFGLDVRSVLHVGEMPLGQRRVHRLRLRTYSTRLDEVVFEELADLEAPFDSLPARAAASDAAAISALSQRLRRDPFVSDRRWTASFSPGDVAAFVGYEDDHQTRAKQRQDSAFAVAAVADAPALREAIFCDGRIRKALDSTGDGKLPVRFNAEASTLPLPAEIADKAPLHLDLAIAQALCGAGAYVAAWEGKPVADYALFLFEQHMLAALRRRDGELVPTQFWPEGFDPMQQDGIEWREGRDGETDPDDDLDIPRVPS